MSGERGYFQIHDDACGMIHIAHDAMSNIVSAACPDTEGVSAMFAVGITVSAVNVFVADISLK